MLEYSREYPIFYIYVTALMSNNKVQTTKIQWAADLQAGEKTVLFPVKSLSGHKPIRIQCHPPTDHAETTQSILIRKEYPGPDLAAINLVSGRSRHSFPFTTRTCSHLFFMSAHFYL